MQRLSISWGSLIVVGQLEGKISHMNGLYTNRNTHGDFIEDALYRLADHGRNVFIAVAFFTGSSVVEKLLEKGCLVRLIVRLGYPTNPDALLRILEKVEIRFFTHHSFHPKLYIFDDQEALIGSANLTKPAVRTNQEVMVSIVGRDKRFDELATLFAEYWEEAAVLTEEKLKKYKKIYRSHSQIDQGITALTNTVNQDIGNVAFHNIGRERRESSKRDVSLEDYRKTYQESVTAFNKIRVLYESLQKRKVDERLIPLRLEIDSFLSFVRDEHATGDSWSQTPIGWKDQQKSLVRKYLDEWFAGRRPYFEDTIVNVNYPKLIRLFTSHETIINSSDDELFDALTTLHSLRERLRFFPGGLSKLKATFFETNDGKKIRESLSYLIFGDGDVIERMANLISHHDYKLNQFGQANVQELVGWCSEEYPVINGRTTKILRFFGFPVRQLS